MTLVAGCSLSLACLVLICIVMTFETDWQVSFKTDDPLKGKVNISFNSALMSVPLEKAKNICDTRGCQFVLMMSFGVCAAAKGQKSYGIEFPPTQPPTQS